VLTTRLRLSGVIAVAVIVVGIFIIIIIIIIHWTSCRLKQSLFRLGQRESRISQCHLAIFFKNYLKNWAKYPGPF
jgi:hypothetical protein